MEAEEQQLQEIEALQAIYGEHELEVVNSSFPNITVEFTLSSATQGSEESDDDFSLKLTVSLPQDYPDAVPSLSLDEWQDDFSDATIERVLTKLRGVAEENIGMLMVFTIISSLQDEIGHLIEERTKENEEMVEMEKKKEEEKEQKKFIGTAVTPDSFKKWKADFDKERLALKEKKIKEREAALAGKLTGRQQFLKDATLNMSDATIIEQSTEVDIDESLFDNEDLEGLDLDEEDC